MVRLGLAVLAGLMLAVSSVGAQPVAPPTPPPAMALWAGVDGLDVIRRVVRRARVLLRPGGTLVVEHSDRQGESAPGVFSDAGFADVRDHVDLTGRPRFTTGRWPA